MPDVFVPGDTTGASLYLSELQWNGVFNAFVFDYLNHNELTMNLNDFIAKFQITDALLNQFTSFAKAEFDVELQPNEFRHSKERIGLLLKAEVARHLFLENGYYRVINNRDVELKRALASF